METQVKTNREIVITLADMQRVVKETPATIEMYLKWLQTGKKPEQLLAEGVLEARTAEEFQQLLSGIEGLQRLVHVYGDI